MNDKIKNRFPNNFPVDLYQKAYSLEHLGIYNCVWEYEGIVEAVNFLCNKGYIILGGDVYESINGIIKGTYDNWYYNPNLKLDNNKNIENSKQKA